MAEALSTDLTPVPAQVPAPVPAPAPGALERTPLYTLHRALGARFVPFAGYEMPVQFPLGVLGEHRHTRAAAGLFDVSHMGQIRIAGPHAAAALERLVPGDLQALGLGRQRYTLFTDETGGIRDDLMVTRREDHLFLVVNASNKAADLALLRGRIGDLAEIEPLPDRALLALQGPGAAAIVADLAPELGQLRFLQGAPFEFAGAPCFATRSGYTGEDGFEISVPAEAAEALARRILDYPGAQPIGLGARDSLRLEAGLCLHGHDIDPGTSAVEADLAWAISPRRRAEGGFPGHAPLMRQLAEGAPRKRVGLLPEGRAPAREGAEILAQTIDGARAVGRVTSGGFGPSVEAPIAMGYVEREFAAPGTALQIRVRDKALPARVVPLPFVPHRYFRKP